MTDIHINIGSEKSAFFVPISIYLIRRLQQTPFIYYAVEEAIQCQKQGYYSSSILVFSQLLNLMKEKTPQIRHEVAHNLLHGTPDKTTYVNLRAEVLGAMKRIQEEELEKHSSVKDYQKKIDEQWLDLIRVLKGMKPQK